MNYKKIRFRPKNFKECNPEIFKRLIKNNPYMGQVYSFPDILYPHPCRADLQKIIFKSRVTKNKSHTSKIHLEIGSGSGRYLIEWANRYKNDFFIGFELRYKRLVFAAKKIKKQNLNNIILMRERGEFFYEYFKKNTVDYLHINFPDPWSKKNHQKNRLLNINFLTKLSSIMNLHGEFRFKTDHLEYFEKVTGMISKMNNFYISEYTKDLHKSSLNNKNILTEFEMLFKSKDNPSIYYFLAKKIKK
tara:strand:+ start:70 stop:807 length:738 start_codon:yes stop_codon:yes gene_type:complete